MPTTIMTTYAIDPSSKRHCSGCIKWRMSTPDEHGVTAPYCSLFHDFLLQDYTGELLRLRVCKQAEIVAIRYARMEELIERAGRIYESYRQEEEADIS